MKRDVQGRIVQSDEREYATNERKKWEQQGCEKLSDVTEGDTG